MHRLIPLRAYFWYKMGTLEFKKMQALLKPNEQLHGNVTKCIPAICMRHANK